MAEALLQVPSGRTAARIPLPDPAPKVIEHDDNTWVRSHQCVSGVVYARERRPSPRQRPVRTEQE